METGQWLGGYRLIERLGIGGAGTVWLAEDEGGMRVALKLLHPALAHSEHSRTRLIRETQNVNAVRSDGVAHVLDVEVDDAQPFIVSEFIEGPTLSSLLRQGALPFDQVIELAQDLHATLEAVHRAGIVHRDVKPGNVIMSPKGPVLIDFGIAQSNDDDPLTITGFVSGTAGYASPELLRGQGASEESDWWAWAATLLTSATGRPPFGGGAQEAVMRRVLEGDPDVTGLPADLAGIFTRAFVTDLSTRYTPEEVLWSLTHREDFILSDDSDENPTASDEATVVLPTAAPPSSANISDHDEATAVLPTPLPPTEAATEYLTQTNTLSTPEDATLILPTYDPPINRPPAPHLAQTSVLPTTPDLHPQQSISQPSYVPQPPSSYDAFDAGPAYQEYAPEPIEGTGPNWAPLSDEAPAGTTRARPTPLVGLTLMLTVAMLPILLGMNGAIAAAITMLLLAIPGVVSKTLSKRSALYGQTRSSDYWIVALQSPLLLLWSTVNLAIGAGFGIGMSILAWWLGHPYLQQIASIDPWMPLTLVQSTQPMSVFTMTDSRPVILALYGMSALICVATWAMPTGDTLREGIAKTARTVLAPTWARVIFVLMLLAAIVATWGVVNAATVPWG